jgi:transposase
MDSTELYSQLLGVTAPWTVQRVEMDVHGLIVDVYLEHPKGVRFACPSCGQSCSVYDHLAERRWRHLDSCHFRTVLHAQPPRVECPEHGVHQASLPWAEGSARFTRMFESLAIDVLLATDVFNAASLLAITWDEAWHIMERAVWRGRAAKARHVPVLLGVDEKAHAKGHQYATIVYDLRGATVEYLGKGRDFSSLAAYFRAFEPGELATIKGITLDMCQAYINACSQCVPEGQHKMVFDRFHIMRQMLEAVDAVRKREHRQLQRQGDNTLARSKYLWLYSAENIPAKARDRFKELKNGQLRTARAWAIKESLRELWSYESPTWGRKFWDRWYFWATHSKLPEIVKVAKLINSHLTNVLSYFTHRITNAVAEGLNSKIATIQKRAYGFRNFEHFQIAVYFHCGGLGLWPSRFTHTEV